MGNRFTNTCIFFLCLCIQLVVVLVFCYSDAIVTSKSERLSCGGIHQGRSEDAGGTASWPRLWGRANMQRDGGFRAIEPGILPCIVSERRELVPRPAGASTAGLPVRGHEQGLATAVGDGRTGHNCNTCLFRPQQSQSRLISTHNRFNIAVASTDSQLCQRELIANTAGLFAKRQDHQKITTIPSCYPLP